MLSATGGFEGKSILDRLAWPSRFWAVGPSLAETPLDFGQRPAASDEDNLAALPVPENEAKHQRDRIQRVCILCLRPDD